uniref:Uncharacterized protein n=1 Tax=Arundo donax TaxID=35708 RepID=A0A0A9EF78_ARUDO
MIREHIAPLRSWVRIPCTHLVFLATYRIFTYSSVIVLQN